MLKASKWFTNVCGLNHDRKLILRRFLSAALNIEKQAPPPKKVFEEDAQKKPPVVDIESLKQFKSKHGHLLVPARFGFKKEEQEGLGPFASTLGRHTVKLRQAYLKLKDNEKQKPWVVQLQNMGFVWAPREEAFRHQVRAMLHYQKLFGDFLIPCKFVVPAELEDWPKEFHNMKLGRLCEQFRFGRLPPHREAYLKEMGIPREDLITQRAERILQAIEVYKKVYHQAAESLSIKKTFVVPVCDEVWPEQLWGMHLGEMVYTIKHMHCFEKYLTQFEAAGVQIMPKEYVEFYKAQVKVRNKARKEAQKAMNEDPLLSTEELKTLSDILL